MGDEGTRKDTGEERFRPGPEVEAQRYRKGVEQLGEEQDRYRKGIEERDDSDPEVEAQRYRTKSPEA